MTQTKQTRAVVATISLGFKEMEVLMLPSGEYRIAASQVAEMFGFDTNQASRDIKALLGKGFQFDKVSSELNPKAVNILSIEQVGLIATELSSKGNQLAKAYLQATFVEAIERRADAAFDVRRTEEERQRLLIQRIQGILVRNCFTDAIHGYAIKNKSSDKYKQFVYSNCSDAINKAVLGIKAKDAREHYQLNNSQQLRDFISREALIEVEMVENYAERLILNKNVEPLTAVKTAIKDCYTKTIGL